MKLGAAFAAPARNVVFPRLLGTEQRKPEKIIQSDGLLFCKRIVGGHDESPDVRLRELHIRILPRVGRFADNSKVKQPFIQFFRYLLRITAGDMVLQTRITLFKPADLSGQIADMIRFCKTKVEIAAGNIVEGQKLLLDRKRKRKPRLI